MNLWSSLVKAGIEHWKTELTQTGPNAALIRTEAAAVGSDNMGRRVILGNNKADTVTLGQFYDGVKIPCLYRRAP